METFDDIDGTEIITDRGATPDPSISRKIRSVFSKNRSGAMQNPMHLTDSVKANTQEDPVSAKGNCWKQKKDGVAVRH